MKNFLDTLQQAWQSQCHKPLDINPDQLLKTARLEQRMVFWADMFVIGVLVCVGSGMWRWALRDIRRDWPWLIYTASDVWVVGYMLLIRWRRRRDATHYDKTLLARVEWSIRDIEHRMWLDRYSPWWYLLPLALGCMIPPLFFFGMEYFKRPLLKSLIPLVVAEGVFAAVFTFVHVVMRFGQRKSNEKRRRELQALHALRDSLLNTEEPNI